MDFDKIYGYYSREDVKNFIFEFSRRREVAGVFENGAFSERPNCIQYPQDVVAMVKTGVVEFHGSLEHWSNPMAIRQNNYDELRIGWDLILDIDCKDFEHGKIATEAFVWGLNRHGLSNVSLKFTGGKGFHIGVPWESFPKEINYKSTIKQYPELARTIAFFLKKVVKERFERNLLKKFSPEELSVQSGKPLSKIFTDDGINPFEIVDVDPVLISPRHFFRLPYSVNRKTGLVSLPINPGELENFRKEHAAIDTIEVKQGFLDRHSADEAGLLVIEASDWWANLNAEKRHAIIDEQMEKMRKRGYAWMNKGDIGKFNEMSSQISAKEDDVFVPKEYFPPCIKGILEGLSDGRKRSLFILFNFLRSSKWNWDDIERTVIEWNAKNKLPLPESFVRSSIRWHRARNSTALPPNCENEGWYKNIGVCNPDPKCKSIKNPLNYAIHGVKDDAKNKEKAKPKKRAKKQPKRQM